MSDIRPIPLLAAVFLASAAWGADTTPLACTAPNVGFQVLTFGSMNLGVWYPTASPESSRPYGKDISGSVALNAPVSTCAQYPLVVFSHGYGGCGTQSVFLTEQLARSGYIVAAPDHADAGCSVTSSTGTTPTISVSLSPPGEPSFLDPSSWNSQSYLNRYTDNENTINGMLQHPQFGPQIDASRIAMSGHSLGGYDTFAMIGGWSTWLDRRIRVGLMLSPYIQPFLFQNPSTVPNANVPQMYQGGTLDVGITPAIIRSGGAYDQAQLPKIFLELQGAGHLDFSDWICASANTVQNCLATAPNAARIVNYSIAFLNFYLNGGPAPLLWDQGQGLAAYWRDTPASAVSCASFIANSPLAPGEITALFGQGLANSTAGASSTPLPSSLAGSTVTVTDSKGAARTAQLFFASPQQVNFLVPAGAASGNASVSVTIGGSVVASGKINVAGLAPSLFSADGTGTGLMNGFVQTLTSGTVSYTLPFDSNTLAPVPVDVSSGNVYLVLAATGAASGSALSAQANIGRLSVPVTSVGPYSPYIGVDAIALGPLPAALTGAGMQTISISIGGIPANPVSIVLK